MPDAYLCWLIRLIGDGYSENCYWKLLRKLHSTPFFYELDYDRNRAVDGLCLRKKFVKETTGTLLTQADLETGPPCSVLEMLVALSMNAEDSLSYNPEIEGSTKQWFWTIMHNLKLDIYTDNYWFEENVEQILNVFMHHFYAFDGTGGGAFPCPGVEKDMRTMDIWWQLGAYFNQNCSVQIW